MLYKKVLLYVQHNYKQKKYLQKNQEMRNMLE